MRLAAAILIATVVSAAADPLPVTTVPAAVGTPHFCSAAQNYPLDAIRRGEEGVVTLAFTITVDGTLRDIVVAKSSGSTSLDEAAMRCAAPWRYAPAMRDGHAVEAPWTARVSWSLHGGPPEWTVPDGVLAPKPGGEPAVCYSQNAIRGFGPGNSSASVLPTIASAGRTVMVVTALFFRVAADGSVKDIQILHSAGDAVLDEDARSCVAKMHYEPATQAGAPVEVNWGTRIVWITS